MTISRDTLDGVSVGMCLEHYQARKRASHSVRKVSCGGTLMMSLMLSSCAGAESGDGFPDPDDAYIRGGIFESPQAIRSVQPGMTKDQVRHLLGSPHFAEGRLNAQRWDYLFDLSGDARPGTGMCQFQLTFDGAMRVEKTRWRTAECAVRYSAIQIEPLESDDMGPRYHLPVVGMFSEEGRLTADGRQALEEFAQILQRDFHAPMLVIGSYPEPGRYRAQCEAVQRFLRARDGEVVGRVSLTSEDIASCRGLDVDDTCLDDQVVIAIQAR